MADLQIGLLGCGFFGRALAHGVERVDGLQMAAVADVSNEAARTAAAELGVPVVSSDRLVGYPGLDGVIVATPNGLHRGPVEEATAAGLHVFVEKPMALTSADCAAMADSAAQQGVQLIVGHILRTLPASRRFKQLVESGQLGDVVAAKATLTRWVQPDPDKADWWKRDPKRSGGELRHEIHALDLLCWLLGTPTSVVGAESPDVSELVLRFGACVASYELSSVNRFPAWGVSIHGTVASALLDLRAATLMVVSDGDVTEYGVFDEHDADESLRAAAVAAQRYNRAGAPTALWMQRAIDLELQETVRVFRGARVSPLLDAQDRAIRVVEQLTSPAEMTG